ncbi:MAG: hypothetical protein UW64_C0001G0075 [Microgenomates group bacterium GW2011_GWC1_44_37]|uniref:Uncharacterized protein n=1 Tax=Candidatus Collierbacteria bacterium GW2011_GWB2_44_22 TaxID=1618387 RepID=A0A0G1HYE0_9BACT|nr:MAG: hypothetical protein UW31_C0009G0053 [Candidatus Collierbacteria bacterium GW2011_GWA2_44_13]KKT51975.1 MAG: hypothetical protein UW44_C0005G0017 [Candidatus Collierbacteria bacterium GW2011_GWB2_44_22]KKT62270.1 MAG: hypothetical protein UW56_C0009G0044 [Candidatus Collierbacteria bacterium GW2011_GWD1_44_27]KKT66617.1 MAG: hypothetical protein UW58_C0005G0013 [Candidatus Collierbacteria bacterium GW2011_GWC2_44_30]KKT69429.1 MAG: hypothetical protein UW64_C0001G0075 [Microgenomates gr
MGGSFSKPVSSAKDSDVDLKTINEKLDKILGLLSPSVPKVASKELTAKILDEIDSNLEKTPSIGKKKTKKVAKKSV